MTNFIFAIERQPGVFEEVPYGASITVGDTLHSWQVAELWSDAELAAIGIYRVAPLTTLAGQWMLSQTFERDGSGNVVAVGTFEDLPPPPIPTLTPKQLILGLLADEFITPTEAVAAAQTGAEPAAIKAIFDANLSDPTQRAIATVTWAKLSEAIRTDPLTLMIQQSRNMSDAAVDAMWLRWATL